MQNGKESRYRKLHAIQLIELNVQELYIKANEPPDPASEIDKKGFQFATGYSAYDKQSQCIQVAVKLEIGMEEDTKSPISMRIELGGVFKVDESEFPQEQVNDWARRNAPLILYPYVREHAFALTARCGFRPIILPLLEVPTLVLQEAKNSKQEETKNINN
jgi:preprotein translocase subunit SecB